MDSDPGGTGAPRGALGRTLPAFPEVTFRRAEETQRKAGGAAMRILVIEDDDELAEAIAATR